jgi:hypothetical protein
MSFEMQGRVIATPPPPSPASQRTLCLQIATAPPPPSLDTFQGSAAVSVDLHFNKSSSPSKVLSDQTLTTPLLPQPVGHSSPRKDLARSFIANLLLIIQGAIFLWSIIFNGGMVPLEQNPAAGPRLDVLTKLGALYVPCLKVVSQLPTEMDLVEVCGMSILGWSTWMLR